MNNIKNRYEMNKLTKKYREKSLDPKLVRSIYNKIESAAIKGEFKMEDEVPTNFDAQLLRDYYSRLGYSVRVGKTLENPKYKKSFFKIGAPRYIFKENYICIHW